MFDQIPFDTYRFAVVTVAHNSFCDPKKEMRDHSRKVLTEHGYRQIAVDISTSGGYEFEDWWVDESLVDSEALASLEKSYGVKNGEQFMMGETVEDKPEEETVETQPNQMHTITRQQPRLWVVDDFYKNPEQIRDFALAQEYHQGGLGKDYIGRRTFQQFLFPGLKEAFEDIMQMKVTKWEDYGMNGRFQTNWGGDPLAYHVDSQEWAAMIYLTPNAPFSCGTTLHAHKKTCIRDSRHPRILECFEGINLDSTIYEPVDVIGNVYNRLVIFDAKCLHSASNYFGYDAHSGRLWHMFFFDAE